MEKFNIKNNASPLVSGMQHVFGIRAIPDKYYGENEIILSDAFTWLSVVSSNEKLAPYLGFDPSMEYTSDHMTKLSQLLIKIWESDEYKKNKEIPLHLLETWQELQGKVLLAGLSTQIESVAGGTLLNIANSRTRIGDIMEKKGMGNYVKAGIAAGSFGIMSLFQYRLFESVVHAFAQKDINDGKTGMLVDFANSAYGLPIGSALWGAGATCLFAYCVKQGFETHLSDKLMGTKRTKKKISYALICAALLAGEMTGSFSRITIGTDLKEQAVDMKKGIKKVTNGDDTVFAQLDFASGDLGSLYESEGKAMYEDESRRGGVGTFAAAKQASYIPKKDINFAQVSKTPGLQEKVNALYEALSAHRKKMGDIESSYGITLPAPTKDITGPRAIKASGYYISKIAEDLDMKSQKRVDSLLESHNLMNPSFTDVIANLVFDNGKNLSPKDLNTLRADIDSYIESSGKNIDEIVGELDATVRTLNAFMVDTTAQANKAYPNSPSSYAPKALPAKPDTTALKEALKNTKVPVSVLDPFGVWSKFIKLSGDGTIPIWYSIALLLRVLLVEGVLLSIGAARVRQTHKSLSTRGAHFEDLARETDGQYLKIIDSIEGLTGGEAWKMVHGKAMTHEEIHTLITTAIAYDKEQSALGNHMTVVDKGGKQISSLGKKFKEGLGAAFFGQYSAPEIRRLHDIDNSLQYWKDDIVPSKKKPKVTWSGALRGMISPSNKNEDTQDNSLWDAPSVVTKEGAHIVRSQVADLLGGANPLHTLAINTSKRHTKEDTKQKAREWENTFNGITFFIKENPSYISEISQIRSDENHVLYNAIKVLDETGDIFGFYKKENQDLNSRFKSLMGSMSEVVFFGQKDEFNRKTANDLKRKLSILSGAGVLSPDESAQVLGALATEPLSLLETDFHNNILKIIVKHKDRPIIRAHIGPSDWMKLPDLNNEQYNHMLSEIDAKIKQAETIGKRKKQIAAHIKTSLDGITELDIMRLRSAGAELKNYFENDHIYLYVPKAPNDVNPPYVPVSIDTELDASVESNPTVTDTVVDFTDIEPSFPKEAPHTTTDSYKEELGALRDDAMVSISRVYKGMQVFAEQASVGDVETKLFEGVSFKGNPYSIAGFQDVPDSKANFYLVSKDGNEPIPDIQKFYEDVIAQINAEYEAELIRDSIRRGNPNISEKDISSSPDIREETKIMAVVDESALNMYKNITLGDIDRISTEIETFITNAPTKIRKTGLPEHFASVGTFLGDTDSMIDVKGFQHDTEKEPYFVLHMKGRDVVIFSKTEEFDTYMKDLLEKEYARKLSEIKDRTN